MIAALWANMNYDDDKGTRKRIILELNAQHEEAVEAIEAALLTSHDIPEEEKLADDNPFFAAAERGLSRIEVKYEKQIENLKNQSRDDDKKPEKTDYMKGVDQA